MVGFLLAGCAAPPAGPSAGLNAAAAVPLTAAVAAPEGVVALVPSPAIETFLTTGPDTAQSYLVMGATAILHHRFPGLVLVDNLDEARARGAALTLELDIQHGRASDLVRVTVLDGAQKPVSRLEAVGSDPSGEARRGYDEALRGLRGQVIRVFQ